MHLTEQQQFDAALTRCQAAEIALRRVTAPRSDVADEQQGALSYSEEAIRLRMARGQATPSDYVAWARMSNRNRNLANASGASQPGREHFDSDADYRAARAWSR